MMAVMQEKNQIAVGQIYTHLLPLQIGKFLESNQFSLFLKNQGLEDAWNQFLVESQDRPDLYGTSVRKNAFTLFLLHIFHRYHEKFPGVVRDFFKSIAPWSSHPLPVFELKNDLQNLGYSENEVNIAFF
jgi:hypothetical protein